MVIINYSRNTPIKYEQFKDLIKICESFTDQTKLNRFFKKNSTKAMQKMKIRSQIYVTIRTKMCYYKIKYMLPYK